MFNCLFVLVCARLVLFVFGFWRPQQESNLYFSLRRTTLYPFNYGAGASNFKAFLIYELERLPNRAKFLWFVSGDFSFNRPRFWSAALSGCLNRLKGSFCTAKPFFKRRKSLFRRLFESLSGRYRRRAAQFSMAFLLWFSAHERRNRLPASKSDTAVKIWINTWKSRLFDFWL